MNTVKIKHLGVAGIMSSLLFLSIVTSEAFAYPYLPPPPTPPPEEIVVDAILGSYTYPRYHDRSCYYYHGRYYYGGYYRHGCYYYKGRRFCDGVFYGRCIRRHHHHHYPY
jgi:hypothetical protein